MLLDQGFRQISRNYPLIQALPRSFPSFSWTEGVHRKSNTYFLEKHIFLGISTRFSIDSRKKIGGSNTSIQAGLTTERGPLSSALLDFATSAREEEGQRNFVLGPLGPCEVAMDQYNTYRYNLLGDELSFTSNFDVHQVPGFRPIPRWSTNPIFSAM